MCPTGKAVAVAMGFGLLLCGSVIAQMSGGPYRIDPVVIASGGGLVAGDTYQITSTLGQPATSTLSGANYTLFNGFWSPLGGVENDFIFADGFDGN